jgi:AcrR family transcriptional regulator
MKRSSSRQVKSRRHEREARRRQELRQAIIQAAEAVMTRQGYTALTMDDVAREAELSKATVYHYFRSKGSIVLELFLDYFDRFYREIVEIKSQPKTTIEKLRAIIDYFLHFHEAKESLSRILLIDKAFLQKMRLFVGRHSPGASGRQPDLMAEIKSRREKILEEVAGLLAEGVAKGEFRPLDPKLATRLIEALLQGFIHNRFWSPVRLPLAKQTDLLLNFILWGVGWQRESAKGA